MTAFAFGIAAFKSEAEGGVARLSVLALTAALPAALASPAFGWAVDRFGPRRMVRSMDIVACLAILTFALVFAGKRGSVPTMYAVAAICGIANGCRLIALSSLVTSLDSAYVRTRMMAALQVAPAIAQFIAPAIAAFFLARSGLKVVTLIDAASYVPAIVTSHLLPRESAFHASDKPGPQRHSLWRVLMQPEVRALVVLLSLLNFTRAISSTLLLPLVLTLGTVADFGTVASCAGIGMILGVVLTLWAVRPHWGAETMAFFVAAQAICAVLIGAMPSLWAIATANAAYLFTLGPVAACNGVLWMAAAPERLRGRVFAIRFAIPAFIPSAAYSIVGLLADPMFEPLMSGDHLLATKLGWVIGTGPGRGYALMIALCGCLLMGVAAWLWLGGARRIESSLARNRVLVAPNPP